MVRGQDGETVTVYMKEAGRCLVRGKGGKCCREGPRLRLHLQEGGVAAVDRLELKRIAPDIWVMLCIVAMIVRAESAAAGRPACCIKCPTP